MKVTKGTPNQFKAALQNQINMLEGRGRHSVQECQNIEAATEMSSDVQAVLEDLDALSGNKRIDCTDAIVGNFGLGSGDIVCIYVNHSGEICAFATTGETAQGVTDVYALIYGAFEDDIDESEFMDYNSIGALRTLQDVSDALDDLTDDEFDGQPGALVEIADKAYYIFEDNMGQIIAFNEIGDVFTNDDGFLAETLLSMQ